MELEGVSSVGRADGGSGEGDGSAPGTSDEGDGDTSVAGCDGVDDCVDVLFPDFFVFVGVSDVDEEEADGSFF